MKLVIFAAAALALAGCMTPEEEAVYSQAKAACEAGDVGACRYARAAEQKQETIIAAALLAGAAGAAQGSANAAAQNSAAMQARSQQTICQPYQYENGGFICRSY